MAENFSYHNPTKLYFGDESLNYLKDELKNFGPVVLLNYGSGSVKRNGIYDQVVAILKEAGKTIVKNPQDYEARSNIMWTATWALNTLIGLGKHEDWMVHMIGHSVGAWTHAPHGYCLAAVSMAYYRRAMKSGLAKFVRFAKIVWGINGGGMTDQQIAEAGLEALKNWMLEIGLPLTISEIGATPDMISGITEGTICYPAGYLDLKPEDITEILKESM